MKSNVMPSIIRIEREELNVLMTEVKETVAIEYQQSAVVVKRKSFGITDLWNCRRHIRTASSLRSR